MYRSSEKKSGERSDSDTTQDRTVPFIVELTDDTFACHLLLPANGEPRVALLAIAGVLDVDADGP